MTHQPKNNKECPICGISEPHITLRIMLDEITKLAVNIKVVELPGGTFRNVEAERKAEEIYQFCVGWFWSFYKEGLQDGKKEKR